MLNFSENYYPIAKFSPPIFDSKLPVDHLGKVSMEANSAKFATAKVYHYRCPLASAIQPTIENMLHHLLGRDITATSNSTIVSCFEFHTINPSNMRVADDIRVEMLCVHTSN